MGERIILYRVLLDRDTRLTTAIPGVLYIMPRTRGVMVQCSPDVTEEALMELDRLVDDNIIGTVEGPPPGRARMVQAGDDRTEKLTKISSVPPTLKSQNSLKITPPNEG